MNPIAYRVHRASSHPVETTVSHLGEDVRAIVTQLEVELTPVDAPEHGTLTLRFFGRQAEEARALFRSDAVVEVSVAAAP